MSGHCAGCIYWRTASQGKKGGGFHFCHYALDNHKCRLVPAERCPYKTTEEEAKILGKINETEALKLHALGWSDVELARQYGVTPSGIFHWRKSRGLAANVTQRKTKKREDPSMAVQVPSIEALPEEVREKVKAAAGNAQGVVIDMDRMNRNAEQQTGPVCQQPELFDPEVNKSIYLPEEPEISTKANLLTEEYDPLIYDVFDLSIAKCYDRGIQPGLIWRKLFQTSEDHLGRLRDYLPMSEETCRCAIELAALAAVEDVRNENS